MLSRHVRRFVVLMCVALLSVVGRWNRRVLIRIRTVKRARRCQLTEFGAGALLPYPPTPTSAERRARSGLVLRWASPAMFFSAPQTHDVAAVFDDDQSRHREAEAGDAPCFQTERLRPKTIHL